MNKYHILSFMATLVNIIIGFSFIFLIDVLRVSNLMLDYFILYLLTMLIAICLYKIGNTHEFNLKYKSFKNDIR